MSDRAEKCPHCGYSINAEHSPYPSIEEATEASAGIPMQEPIETIVEPRKNHIYGFGFALLPSRLESDSVYTIMRICINLIVVPMENISISQKNNY